MKSVEELVSKTIKKAWIEGIEGYDDKPFLFLEMEDGSVFKIISDYGSYTGGSEDEYPRFVKIKKVKSND